MYVYVCVYIYIEREREREREIESTVEVQRPLRLLDGGDLAEAVVGSSASMLGTTFLVHFH